jgi:hypothetical protein
MTRNVEASASLRLRARAAGRLLYAVGRDAGRRWGWVGLALALVLACSKLAEDCTRTLTCPEETLLAPAAPAPGAESDRLGAAALAPREELGQGPDAGAAFAGATDVATLTDAGAPEPLGPVPPGLPPCALDADCEGGTVCDTFFAVCVGCRGNADCTTPVAPRCHPETRTCGGCASNSDCRSGTPQCRDDGVCVECIESEQCADPAAARCQDDACGACSADSDCAHIAGAGRCASGRCIECRDNADCSDPRRAVCSGGRCGGCSDDGDCERFSDSPACGPGGSCVQCSENRHCGDPRAPRCEGTACAPCAEQSDCSHLPGRSVCDTSQGPRECVECTRDDDDACQSASGAQLVCDSLARRCTGFSPGSADLCAPCVADAHCQQAPLSRLCVEQRFDDVSIGHFCLPKPTAFENGPACRARVTSVFVEEQLSIDGARSDMCHLPTTTTCPGLNDFEQDEFAGADCGTGSGGSDALCGAPGVDDGVCVSVGQVNATFHCRIPCSGNNDCPLGTACTGGLCEE